ncbi:DUF1214 domain-containing protein [Parahaliea maris]|uniref:DUF1214 domain-containing protein n=1 Tax=Parahaliea maris TaxID=2716870 RepID=A0A5C9A7M8_9GAMM|nr:DUF1214 domain-containing protein [Parahaliea maris]TXS95567.1 DUF1214 domain-containing protein [Parahaliea maris]
MDRREFLQGAGALGGLSLLGTAMAAAEEGGSGSRGAMADLLAAMAEVEQTYLSPAYGVVRPDDVAEGERLLAHVLHTGLQFWLEADLDRPQFIPYVTDRRKLLGDNPDALYYFAAVRGGARYRIRGQIGAATFTSFTVEAGSGEGRVATASLAELDDGSLEIAADGSFEIQLGGEKPTRGNWLPLPPEAAQVTTRHYYETPVSVMKDPAATQVLSIEPVDPPALKPWGGDSEIATRLRHVANFVRGQVAMSIPDPAKRPPIPWVSTVPNQFQSPGQWRSETGYGNLSAWYAMAPYVLLPGQVLEISGRFPPCRFANVVLWNRFMQSYDYRQRTVSFNRNQLAYEDDGSFRLLLAHEDPGHPNWLDTEGRVSGLVYWRYLLPRETPEGVTTRLLSG